MKTNYCRHAQQTAAPERYPDMVQTPMTGARPQGTPPTAGTRPAPETPVYTDIPHKDYEKLFGKSFMGIFASVLIFISLIIFATLMLPYLTDIMKLAGLYIRPDPVYGQRLQINHDRHQI